MNPSAAPLYTAAHAVAVFVLRSRFCETRVGAEAADAALRLLFAVSVALTFPGERAAALRDADRACLALRVSARVGFDLGNLSAGALDQLLRELDGIGRMLGGWQRQRRRRGGLDGTPTV